MTLDELQVVITANIAPLTKLLAEARAQMQQTAKAADSSGQDAANSADKSADKTAKALDKENKAEEKSSDTAKQTEKQKGQTYEEISAIVEASLARQRKAQEEAAQRSIEIEKEEQAAREEYNMSASAGASSRQTVQPVSTVPQEKQVSALQKLRAEAVKVKQALLSMFSGQSQEASEAAAKMASLTAKLDNINSRALIQQRTLSQLRAEYEKLASSGNAGTEQLEGLQVKIVAAESRLQSLTSQSDKTAAAIRELDTAMNETKVSGEKAASGVKTASNAFKTASNGASGFQRELKMLGRQILSQIIVYQLFFSAMSALGSYMWSALKTNTAFSNSLNNLKVQFLTAFQPIYQAVLPALTAFINYLAKAMQYVAAFMSALFGKTYSQSLKNAAALNKNVKALEDTSSAAKKAKTSLSGFDEINTLAKTSSTSSASSTSGLTSTDFSSSSSLLSDEEIAKAEAAGKKVREIFENLASFVTQHKQAIIAAITGIVGAFLTFKSVQFVSKTIEGIGTAFTLITSPAGIIIAALAAVVGEILYLYKTNQNFHDHVIKTWDNIKKVFSTGFDFSGIKNGLSDLQKAFAPFAKTMFDGLSWGMTNVLAPLSKWVINDVLPAFLNILSGALNVLNSVISALEPLGQWLLDNFLKPIAEWTGGVIVTVLDSIAGGLQAVSDWIDTHQEAVQTIAVLVGSFAAAWVLVNTALTIYQGVCSAAALVQWLLNAAMLANPITWIILGIGLLIAAIVLLATHTKEVKKVFTDAGAKIKSVWDNLVKNASNAWDKIKSGAKSGINCLIDGLNSLIKGINQLKATIPSWVPLIGGQTFGFSIPTIPHLARGGVVDTATAFVAGEAGKEAVMPLENNTAWIDTLADKLASKIPRGSNGTFNLTVQSVLDGTVLSKTVLKNINLRSSLTGASALT